MAKKLARDTLLFGRDIIHETTEKIILIKEQLKAAHGLQKSYACVRHKPLEFKVGDCVMLKVAPWKGVIIIGKQGKLNPRYIKPFEILSRFRLVAYKVKLHQELNKVHDTFHVCNFKKCLADENLVVPLDEIRVNTKLHFMEELVEIMDREIKRLKQNRIPIVKVWRNSRRGPEFTWEREDQMKQKYPHLFNDAPYTSERTNY
mgnify:CR=1 FL=1